MSKRELTAEEKRKLKEFAVLKDGGEMAIIKRILALQDTQMEFAGALEGAKVETLEAASFAINQIVESINAINDEIDSVSDTSLIQSQIDALADSTQVLQERIANIKPTTTITNEPTDLHEVFSEISNVREELENKTSTILHKLSESMAKESKSVRELLDVFMETKDTVSVEVIEGLPEELEKLKEELRALSSKKVISGGITQARVLQLIAENAGGGTSQTQYFEYVSKNVPSDPVATINKTLGKVSSIEYTVSGGTRTKTVNRTSGKVSSIVLSGTLPADLSITTKTISRGVDTKVDGWSYS